jgi:glycosyltransferase involved in cell wall biosynthesis
MNITFLTSGHLPYDDRIYYHMALSLIGKGNSVEIVSSKSNVITITDGIKLNCFDDESLSKREKIKQFTERLSESVPEIIICSEPLTILSAKQYSKGRSGKIKIIYDITEWYPSGKNLIAKKIPFKWFTFLKLLLFNFWVARYAGSFIFGEWYKSRPYRILYPFKPYAYISYYPDLKYISHIKTELSSSNLKLSYSGKISLDKGYGNFFRVLNKLTEVKRDLKIDVKIIGWYDTSRDKKDCERLFEDCSPGISLEVFGKQSYKNFLEHIKDTDIFLDLRSDNLENKHCLPIKLFYYAALGRPVIFSDLRAIRKEVEIKKFGSLVDPADINGIVKIILNYLEDRELYQKHCENARYLAESRYNWQMIESQFIRFITSD